MPVNYLTAALALYRMAALAPNETVLVHNAGGGVGIAATQLARLRRDEGGVARRMAGAAVHGDDGGLAGEAAGAVGFGAGRRRNDASRNRTSERFGLFFWTIEAKTGISRKTGRFADERDAFTPGARGGDGWIGPDGAARPSRVSGFES